MNSDKFLLICVFSLLIVACGKDEIVTEEIISPSFFKTELSWQDEILDYYKITSDVLPQSIDIEWHNNPTFTFKEDEYYEAFAFGIRYITAGDTSYTIGASQIIGSDTTFVGFEIFGNLEERIYNFLSLDIFNFLNSGKISEPADGSILPYIIDPQSEISRELAAAGHLGKVDWSGSSFKITEYDQEKGEFSGSFNLKMDLVDDPSQSKTPILRVKDGHFNKLKIYTIRK